MPGPNHALADARRALQTYEAVFAAYSRTPLLNPPRGFEVIDNYNADARETPRGWPIPVGGTPGAAAHPGKLALSHNPRHLRFPGLRRHRGGHEVRRQYAPPAPGA
jgi:hypothetical protein